MLKQSLIALALLGTTSASADSWDSQVPAGLASHFAAAQESTNLPSGLLKSVAYEESRFRTDVITCKVNSHKGAKGIMQIIKKHHPEVDPCDPKDAITYAAKWLDEMTAKYDNETMALYAYNWGPTNVYRWKQGRKSLPRSVKVYANRILSRINGRSSF